VFTSTLELNAAAWWIGSIPDCPGRKPPCLAVKRPARPYKSAIQNRFTAENAQGASTPRAGPDGGLRLELLRRPLVQQHAHDLGSARSECEGGPHRASIAFPYRKFVS
jgi:hypothetical protein